MDATYAHLLVKHKNIVKNYTAEIESLEHKVSSTKLTQEQETKHFNKKIEGLERKLRESTSVSLASKEKQSNEIDRLRSWNKELEARIVAVKTDYEAKEDSINAEHTQQLEHLKQNMNAQTAEIDLLTKRNQLLKEGNDSLRKARRLKRKNAGRNGADRKRCAQKDGRSQRPK